MAPPWASTISLAMARPSPALPLLVPLELSSRKNCSNIRSSFSGGSSRPVCPARRELDEERLCAYLLECWQDWPDMLTTRQAAELCGYSLTTLNHWWKRGQVKGVKYRNELLYYRPGQRVV